MLNIVLVIILFVCLVTDIKYRKILNVVTLPTIVFGLIYNIIAMGFEGFAFSGIGLLVGLGLLIIPYLLGGMGAGDVKLMASIGALMGTSFVFYSFIYMGLIGGLIALILIIKQRGLFNGVIRPLKYFFYKLVLFRSNLGSVGFSTEKNPSISFPYGIAIVLGTLCTLVWGEF